MIVAALALAVPLASAPDRAVVSVYLMARGEDGRPVADLTRNDIEVLSDGVRVPISVFEPASPQLSAVLIVDGTASQPLRRTEILNAVANDWAASLQAGDRVRIGVLADPLQLGSWLPETRPIDLRVFRTSLDRLSQEPSRIWDAIDAGVRALDGTTANRSLILLTDGRAAGNVIGLEDAAERALEVGVAINAVSEGAEQLLPQGTDGTERIRTDTSLRWLAEVTGGACLDDGVARRTARPRTDPFGTILEIAQTPNRPGPLLAQIMAVLRVRYRLGFTVDADGRTHALEIRATRAGLTIGAPRRFRAP